MAPERFRGMQLQEEFDTYDGCEAHLSVGLKFPKFLTRRSKIIEIVTAKDIIFALSQSGLCSAFDRVTNKRIAFFNLSPDEVIRSMLYNKYNDSLITVSIYSSDSYGSLKCRATPIEYVRRNELDAGFPIFESESLKWPGFVEFDRVNGKVLIYAAQDGQGFMLVIYDRTPSYVSLKILSIVDGKPIKSFKHLLHPNKKVDFIDHFNEKLLVKQECENSQILGVWNSELIEINDTKLVNPQALVVLHERNLILIFQNRRAAVWNFQGELVTSFEDHLLWHDGVCSEKNIYITKDEGRIISYCKSEAVEDDVTPIGSINMSEIMTGKCIAKIAANNPTISVAPRRNGCNERSSVSCTPPEALKDVTAVLYDEDRNEIYTGNKHGLLHVWSNSSGFIFGKL
ncbi:hypothetical protein C2845_PM05G17150 [Panicum miliaceum]|uniref:Uncharacterized protein n=1 Tax=Panicum miliaceum TaxID=4540 RepID=A0A3L6T6J7_PANMI|nr:hypothetical protein C2845_PM05G17150 [Panicum miliaceum]